MDPPTTAIPLTAAQHMTYRKLIGSVLYAANLTRMDISHTVGVLCQHLNCPTDHHYNAAFYLLGYLAGTIDHKLLFHSSDSDNPFLCAYSDADWGNDKNGRKSTSGVLVQMNGTSVYWSSKKQTCVSLSSTQAEYVALASTFQQCIWMITWLSEVLGEELPVTVYCDNKSAILLSDKEVQNTNKHIDIRFHFLCDTKKRLPISVEWCSTKDQLADVLTKTLGRQLFEPIRDRLLVQ
jgi:hypothetical protein